MCASVTRRDLLARVGKATGVLAGVAGGVGGFGAAVADSRSPAYRVDGDTFHADGKTFVSAWTHEKVPHARAFERVMGHDIATLMEFDHWNCQRLRGTGNHPGRYREIVDAGYAPHVVWNGPYSVEGEDPWPVGTPPAAVYQQGGKRFGEFCADVAAGRLDGKLRAMATEFAAVDAPILFCPWEEANGDWRPAIGTAVNGPETWAAAWRRMVEVFRSVGATNVAWVLAPSGNILRRHPVGTANGLDKWYPGDEYVDYVGTSFYDHGGAFHSAGDPADVLDELLGQFNQVTGERKPYIQNEVGVHTEERNAAAGPSASEWTGRMMRALRDRPQVVGLLWWDRAPDGLDVTGQDWDTEPWSLTATGRAFRAALDHPTFTDSLALGPETGSAGQFVDDCNTLMALHESTATGALTVATGGPGAEGSDAARCSTPGGRIVRRHSTAPVDLVYAPPGVVTDFEVVFHDHTQAGGRVSFAASTDGGDSWTGIPSVTTASSSSGLNWRRAVYESEGLPPGTDRLRIRLAGGSVPWSGQVGHVVLDTRPDPLGETPIA